MADENSHDKYEKPQHDDFVGPGQRLRQAREALNLSKEDVAKRLYLSVQIVEALEREDFESLPQTPFVLGYLRNYAKLVELPADEIVSTYVKAEDVGTPIKPIPGQTETYPRLKTNRDSMKWVVYLILLFILLAVGWFLLQSGNFWEKTDRVEQQQSGDVTPGMESPAPFSERDK
jgi:cytoskeleton protein RodZ